MTFDPADVGVVVIGRNEGDRLRRCLHSIPAGHPVVYVDSGSSDGSVEFAESLGITTVQLDLSRGFTAARARNAGWRRLLAHDDVGEGNGPASIQFVDGDCELDPGWIAAGVAALADEPQLAVVFGRRRERFPERSIFNRMCDEEWDVPVGLVNACGGDALFRRSALEEAGGYSDDLIAGEEPDLCLRLRRRGWLVRRIDAEMTLHDAAILSFGAWWRRTRRSGYAYTAHLARHGAQSDPAWRRQVASITFWALLWPLAICVLAAVAGMVDGRLGLLVMLALPATYALQISRIARRRGRAGSPPRTALWYASLVVIGKFAELGGLVRCGLDRLRQRQAVLIEYKGTR